MNNILKLLIVLVSTFTIFGSSIKASPLDNLVRSLDAYQCIEQATNETTLLIFHEVDGITKLIYFDENSIDMSEPKETESGYSFTVDGQASLYLSEVDNSWRLFGATSEGLYEADCQTFRWLPIAMLDFAYDLIDDVLTDEVEFLSEKVETLSLALAQAESQVVELRESLAETLSEDSHRKVALLKAQVTALESQLSYLQEMLTPTEGGNRRSQIIIESLSQELNHALARVAAEEVRRYDLEEEIARLNSKRPLVTNGRKCKTGKSLVGTNESLGCQ